MSVRSDIIDGRAAAYSQYGLTYTEILGWVDLGHAQGNDIKDVLQQMNAGENARDEKEHYDITYKQGMIGMGRTVTINRFIKWRIAKGRSLREKQSMALAMMLTVARRFESMQPSFPFNLATDSGFSGEDLVSDLLGFYRAVSIPNPFHLLRPVSKEEALKRWDFYGPIGSFKNTGFRPILFPDPEKFRNAGPRLGYLPSFMQTIQPYSDIKSGKVAIASRDGTQVITHFPWGK